MLQTSPSSRPRTGLVLVVPFLLAACAQQQQVAPDDVVKREPTYSKLGDAPVPAE